MKTHILRMFALAATLGFTALAHAQFTGAYAITDVVTHPAQFWGLGSNTLYGNWTGGGSLGSLNTTNAATGSIVLSGTSIGPGQTSSSAVISLTAPADIVVTFDYNSKFMVNPTVPSGSTFVANFVYTTDNWATQNLIATNPGFSASYSFVSGTSYSFVVNSGSIFGFGAGGNSAIGGVGVASIETTISNFSVSAVPEPSTYAMLAGLGAFGVAMLTRLRRARNTRRQPAAG